MTGRLLGVDYGTVRVGLALSDPERRIAFPLSILTRGSREALDKSFCELVTQEQVAGIVVGLPVHTNGREGAKAVEARAFGKRLGDITHLPVVYWDERFSTSQAESALWEAGLSHKKRKERRDKVAAQILLQSYLDAGCPVGDEGAGPLEG